MNDPGPSNRKRRRDELDETDDHNHYDGFMDDESEPHKFGTTVLPVASLPESFDGVPKDGMEYLFTVRREEKRLPLVTRVYNPYAVRETPGSQRRDDTGTTGGQSTLPTEEWRECFEERFRNFRANIKQPTIHISLPRSSNSVSQVPEILERDRWWAFIRGDTNWQNVPSSQFHTKKYGASVNKKKETIDYEEDLPKNKGKMRGWVVYDEQLSWDDADQNAAHGAPSTDASQVEGMGRPRGSSETSEPVPPRENRSKEVMAEGTSNPGVDPVPLGKSREPTPELLNILDQKVTLHLLKFFTRWIQGHFDRSSLPPPPPLYEVRPRTNSHEWQVYDLTPTLARWIFALLSRLDAQLTSGEISVLRQLAREVIRVIKEEEVVRRTANASFMGTAGCWMIVAAIAGTWGQKDLWMDAEAALR